MPLNYIADLPHDELRRLHREGRITVRAKMTAAMHICDRDPRISKSVKAAHHFWKWVGVLMLIGGPLSIFFIKWYWGLLIFLASFAVIRSTRQSAGQFVSEAVLDSESLYYDCLAANVLLITSTNAPNQAMQRTAPRSDA